MPEPSHGGAAGHLGGDRHPRGAAPGAHRRRQEAHQGEGRPGGSPVAGCPWARCPAPHSLAAGPAAAARASPGPGPGQLAQKRSLGAPGPARSSGSTRRSLLGSGAAGDIAAPLPSPCAAWSRWAPCAACPFFAWPQQQVSSCGPAGLPALPARSLLALRPRGLPL